MHCIRVLLPSRQEGEGMHILSTDHPWLPGAEGKYPELEFPEDRLRSNGPSGIEEDHHF